MIFRMSSALIVASSLIACGAQKTTESDLSNAAVASKKVVSAVFTDDVKLGDVTVQSSRGRGPAGIWTTAQVVVGFTCSDELDKVSTSVSRDGKAVTIYVAALVRKNAVPGRACYVKPFEVTTVSIGGGMISKDQIRVVPVVSSKEEIGDLVAGRFVEANRIKVKSLQSLCPEGVKCIVNGTKITIAIEKNCTEYVGPAAFAFDYSTKQLVLAVGSFMNPRAPVMMCSRIVSAKTFDLTVINFYPESIEEAQKSLKVFSDMSI